MHLLMHLLVRGCNDDNVIYGLCQMWTDPRRTYTAGLLGQRTASPPLHVLSYLPEARAFLRRSDQLIHYRPSGFGRCHGQLMSREFHHPYLSMSLTSSQAGLNNAIQFEPTIKQGDLGPLFSRHLSFSDPIYTYLPMGSYPPSASIYWGIPKELFFFLL
ncbi:hypothetical protein BC827DRAFT_929053 [Russula dissimulans]|nr:hypothetical protein BC827DRAFT_929053 [Russula dissimulans]